MRFRSARGVVFILAPFALAALLGGCSGDTLKNLGATSTAEPKPAEAKAPNTDVECPVVQVRNGASTWQEPSGGGTTELKYQASLGQMARECAILGDTMTVKVGVEGRVLTGPKGTPGTIQVPLRLALVQEGPKPKSIWTKFYPVPVTIPAGQSGVPFTHVEDDLTFPLPADKDITAYVIYVGFDPQGLARQKRPPVHHKKKAPRPVAKKKAPPKPAPVASGGFAPPASGGFAPPANGGFAPPPKQGNGGFAPPPGQFSKPAGQ
ncbi:MAG TPA: hypothetical protein VHD34_01510, partial [Xanthobacteraceae bacterium]|nr:hypothetical protein [Xanthobacteraceae bacterium]